MTSPLGSAVENLICEVSEAEALANDILDALERARCEVERLKYWSANGLIDFNIFALEQLTKLIDREIILAEQRSAKVESSTSGVGMVKSGSELKVRRELFAFAVVDVVQALLQNSSFDADTLRRST